MSNFQVLKMALAALTVFMSSFVSHAAQTPVQDQTIRAGGQTFRYLSAGKWPGHRVAPRLAPERR